MVDEKRFKQAFMRLRAFRSHIFGSITETMVSEYHEILEALQETSGDDLGILRIPPSVLLPRVVSQIRYSRSAAHSSNYEPQYTSEKFCEKALFMERVNFLIAYAAEKTRIGGTGRVPTELLG